MNILVTGGMGLIGHNVVKRLQDQGHTVSIVDNKTNYKLLFILFTSNKFIRINYF
jgi:nucleoside-diphosphate-sugar epimerase